MVRRNFPFSAVAGQDQMKLALILCTVDPAIGGVLLRGEKGSGKTTLARALAGLLPPGAPFVELPLGASEERVVGSLDLSAAVSQARIAFQPGLLADVNGGVLYVDEVNLLADHLVDLLLDVAVSGTNRVERDGFSHEHASRFVLIGSMNPEEGELRPQLLDRFGLSVEVATSRDPFERAVAVERRLAFDSAREAFCDLWIAEEDKLRERLRTVVPAPLEEGLVPAVAHLCSSMGAEGIRADLVICRAAAALAGWEGCAAAGPEHVARVANLALAHRARKSPFDDPGLDQSKLDAALEQAFDGSASQMPALEPSSSAGAPRPDPTPSSAGAPTHSSAGASSSCPSRLDRKDAASGFGPSEEVPANGFGQGLPDRPSRPANQESIPIYHDQGTVQRKAPGQPPSPLPAPSEDLHRAAASVPIRVQGTAWRTPQSSTARHGGSGASHSAPLVGTGPVVGSRKIEGSISAIATAPTVAAAAARRARTPTKGSDPGTMPLFKEDLREPLRQIKPARLVVLSVDASGSMGADRRMQMAKGAILGYLIQAYQRRDRVALVTFGGDGARVVLKPTGSVEVARARLGVLPTGGCTPLSLGIRTAVNLAESTCSHSDLLPLLVLVTDGRATAATTGADPWEEALCSARDVNRKKISSIVVDAEQARVPLGLARELAVAMGAAYVRLESSEADDLIAAWSTEELGSPEQGSAP